MTNLRDMSILARVSLEEAIAGALLTNPDLVAPIVRGWRPEVGQAAKVLFKELGDCPAAEIQEKAIGILMRHNILSEVPEWFRAMDKVPMPNPTAENSARWSLDRLEQLKTFEASLQLVATYAAKIEARYG